MFTYYFTRLFSITYDSGIKPAVVSIVVKPITTGGVMKISGILKTLMIGLVLVGSLSFSDVVRASIIPRQGPLLVQLPGSSHSLMMWASPLTKRLIQGPFPEPR